MTYLFDTNHAIAYLNGDPRLTPHLITAQTAGDTFAVSTTVLGELYYGVYASHRLSDNLAKLNAFIAQLMVFDFDTASASEFGRIKAEQRAKGKPIPTADAQIAAVARVHGLTVLTNDAHFSQIDGVKVDNWLS
mgnify:CR=1 FL=1